MLINGLIFVIKYRLFIKYYIIIILVINVNTVSSWHYSVWQIAIQAYPMT